VRPLPRKDFSTHEAFLVPRSLVLLRSRLRVDLLAQRAVEDVGDAAVGTAVANDVLVHRPADEVVQEYHVEHPHRGAHLDDAYGLLFIDNAVRAREDAHVGESDGAALDGEPVVIKVPPI